MIDTRKIFHVISYLQYPMMLVAMYFILQPYFNEFQGIYKSLNSGLIFLGLGVSFSTLQDTTTTQNEVSRKIWEHPTKGKIFLILISIVTFTLIITGIIGVFAAEDALLSELSLGLVVLGIGLVGLLKSASEMFENHRLDKNEK